MRGSPASRTSAALVFFVLVFYVSLPAAHARTNVVLIVTDDQGWGDVGFHGNTKLRTPNLDRLAQTGVRMTRFYAQPVCTPTRAALMSGRYHIRTGAIDTWQGRAVMHPEELTVAERLAAAGYRTGIFGKWHLGDHYPSRAMDQGFAEALVHFGGGIGQASDPPVPGGGGGSYFDPWLERNGKLEQAKGYCSDVYADATIKFIDASVQASKPFFAYLAFNAPHKPLQVADELVRPYRDAGLDEETAKTYAMIENIDANVGRVLAALDAQPDVARDTLVIFMTDNGPSSPKPDRFTGGLRGRKTTVYEGGIRVPFFARWPAGIPTGGRDVDRIAGAVDVAPTILAACGLAPAPNQPKMDGVDLLPLLRSETPPGGWPERTLYAQWHRGDAVDPGRHVAAIGQRYKLVQPEGGGHLPGPAPRDPKWELYDLIADPFEKNDLAATKPEIVTAMRKDYDAWFADVSATRGFTSFPVHVGTPHENPVLLTGQDRRGGEDPVGYWDVRVATAGTYTVNVLFDAADAPRTARLRIGAGMNVEAPVAPKLTEVTFGEVRLDAGDSKLEALVELDGKAAGVKYVRVERR